MKLNDLKNKELNLGIAYFVGLSAPRYNKIDFCDHSYVVGSINHNPNMINSEDLTEHYHIITKLLNNYLGANNFIIKNNQSDMTPKNKKKGFSIFIDKGNTCDNECEEILIDLIKRISNSNDISIKKEFAKGCFDGRSSFDTSNQHYLSVDVDRDYYKQDLIVQILESLGININLNRREKNHKKCDQIRIKKDSVPYFMASIGLYSKCRTNIINKGLNS